MASRRRKLIKAIACVAAILVLRDIGFLAASGFLISSFLNVILELVVQNHRSH